MKKINKFTYGGAINKSSDEKWTMIMNRINQGDFAVSVLNSGGFWSAMIYYSKITSINNTIS
jgi:hypothetical protein